MNELAPFNVFALNREDLFDAALADYGLSTAAALNFITKLVKMGVYFEEDDDEEEDYDEEDE